MIYRHKRTGELYRKLLNYWDVATQSDYTLYTSLGTGAIFGRATDIFSTNFEYVLDVQSKIVPH